MNQFHLVVHQDLIVTFLYRFISIKSKFSFFHKCVINLQVIKMIIYAKSHINTHQNNV